MQTLTFNTGREYSPQGQRIIATLLDNGDIVFLDIDRHIDGVIPAKGLTRDNVQDLGLFTQRGIMHDYDHNVYTGCMPEHLEVVQQLRSTHEKPE